MPDRPRRGPTDMLLCQISDLHVAPGGRPAFGDVDTRGMLDRCVAQIGALGRAPDAVVITGDLVERGTPEEYAILRESLAPLRMPVHVLPGNHDERAALLAAFADHAYLPRDGEFIQYAVDLGPLRLVALDTLVPGAGGGRLCAGRLDWLDRTLAQDARPTVVALHHPPIVTGIAPMDAMGLDGADGLAAVLARHPHVERVIGGHVHRAMSARIAGTVASTCPSPAHHIELDLAGRARGAYVMEPPGFQLHLWTGAALVTHTVPIGRFDGPYPFGGK